MSRFDNSNLLSTSQKPNEVRLNPHHIQPRWGWWIICHS